MNGNWYQWARGTPGYTNTPADFINMWRRAYGLVTAKGLDKNHLQWIWSPMNCDCTQYRLEQYSQAVHTLTGSVSMPTTGEMQPVGAQGIGNQSFSFGGKSYRAHSDFQQSAANSMYIAGSTTNARRITDSQFQGE